VRTIDFETIKLKLAEVSNEQFTKITQTFSSNQQILLAANFAFLRFITNYTLNIKRVESFKLDFLAKLIELIWFETYFPRIKCREIKLSQFQSSKLLTIASHGSRCMERTILLKYLKIILLGHQSSYVKNLSMMNNAAKSFDILATSLNYIIILID